MGGPLLLFWVDPRVGGGALEERYHPVAIGGRSPRGRGSLVHNRVDDLDDGSIPAWAGEPCSPGPRMRVFGVDPRVGGGAPEPLGSMY